MDCAGVSGNVRMFDYIVSKMKEQGKEPLVRDYTRTLKAACCNGHDELCKSLLGR